MNLHFESSWSLISCLHYVHCVSLDNLSIPITLHMRFTFLWHKYIQTDRTLHLKPHKVNPPPPPPSTANCGQSISVEEEYSLCPSCEECDGGLSWGHHLADTPPRLCPLSRGWNDTIATVCEQPLPTPSIHHYRHIAIETRNLEGNFILIAEM